MSPIGHALEAAVYQMYGGSTQAQSVLHSAWRMPGACGSVYVSCPRPHRGSRKMFMLGVQNDRPWYWLTTPERFACWFFMRASSLTASKHCCSRMSSHDAAMPMVIGNTVVNPLRPTPCSASFHHWKLGMPSRSIGLELLSIRRAFSSSVRRPMRSSALCSGERR